MPVATPDEGSMVATPGDTLLQVPPGVASFKVEVLPSQTTGVPVIGASGLTVTVTPAVQPAEVVYCISTVPAPVPVTKPVEAPTVAINGSAVLHVPPAVGSESVVLLPWHTTGTPATGSIGNTLTITDAIQPVDVVYLTITLPGTTPVTIPLREPTDAMAGFRLVQIPPGCG
jgi:hypothetical protein